MQTGSEAIAIAVLTQAQLAAFHWSPAFPFATTFVWKATG